MPSTKFSTKEEVTAYITSFYDEIFPYYEKIKELSSDKGYKVSFDTVYFRENNFDDVLTALPEDTSKIDALVSLEIYDGSFENSLLAADADRSTERCLWFTITKTKKGDYSVIFDTSDIPVMKSDLDEIVRDISELSMDDFLKKYAECVTEVKFSPIVNAILKMSKRKLTAITFSVIGVLFLIALAIELFL